MANGALELRSRHFAGSSRGACQDRRERAHERGGRALPELEQIQGPHLARHGMAQVLEPAQLSQGRGRRTRGGSPHQSPGLRRNAFVAAQFHPPIRFDAGSLHDVFGHQAGSRPRLAHQPRLAVQFIGAGLRLRATGDAGWATSRI